MPALQFATATANLDSQNAFLFLPAQHFARARGHRSGKVNDNSLLRRWRRLVRYDNSLLRRRRRLVRMGDGAPATGISFSVPREARQSRLPLRFDRRFLLRCEHHRRKSVRRAAVHAETRSGQRGKHRRRIVGDGAPATGSLVLWAIVYRTQWRPLSRPPFALRARA